MSAKVRGWTVGLYLICGLLAIAAILGSLDPNLAHLPPMALDLWPFVQFAVVLLFWTAVAVALWRLYRWATNGQFLAMALFTVVVVGLVSITMAIESMLMRHFGSAADQLLKAQRQDLSNVAMSFGRSAEGRRATIAAVLEDRQITPARIVTSPYYSLYRYKFDVEGSSPFFLTMTLHRQKVEIDIAGEADLKPQL
jgi:hypothetical protein